MVENKLAESTPKGEYGKRGIRADQFCILGTYGKKTGHSTERQENLWTKARKIAKVQVSTS